MPILDHDALEAPRSRIAARGVTSLSDDDPTDAEYLWVLVQDLTEACATVERLRGSWRRRGQCSKTCLP